MRRACVRLRRLPGGAGAPRRVAVVALLGATLGWMPVDAQMEVARDHGLFQGEVRGGLTIGSHSASAAALDVAPSVSFDLVLRRQVTGRFAAYGGFFRTSFGCEEGFCTDRDVVIVGNHGALGVEWGSGGPWVRAGVLVGSTEGRSGMVASGSSPKLGVGVHAAAGLTIGMGRFRFLPGLSYRWLSANTTLETGHAIALAMDLGVGVVVGGGGS